jgi:uncharacterized protein (TIGR03437 family)
MVAVEVNGQPAPVLVESPTRVLFECPASAAGTELRVALRNSAGLSNIALTNAVDVAPGIFTIDGTGEGFGSVTHGDTVDLTISEPALNGKPARPGDVVTIFSTGLGRTVGSENPAVAVKPVVWIDGISADVVGATALGRGVYKVDVLVPQAVTPGDRVELTIETPAIDGRMVRANAVGIAIAPAAATE